MLRGLRYIALVLLFAWVVWNLWTRERRRRIDEGFRRAALLISLAFIAVGSVMFYRGMAGPGNSLSQAALMIIVGAGLMAYQRWGRR